MKLYEHEGKALFAKAGIPIPRGQIVNAISYARAAFHELGPIFLKAQVLWGSRGKRKAIVPCESVEEVESAFKDLMGRQIEDEVIETLLAEEKVGIDQECYLSVTYVGSSPAVVASRSGGIDVEQARKENPDAVVVQPVDILKGLDAATAVSVLERAGFAEHTPAVSHILLRLYDLFVQTDAVLVEINPLVLKTDGTWCAVDAKVELDEEALYRQSHLNLPERLSSGRKPTQLEALAAKNDQTDTRGASGRMFYEIPGGNIVMLASGGGTSVEALDSLCLMGGKPGVFTEYSGNPTGDKVKELTKIALSTQNPIDCIWVIGGRANFTDIFETLVNGVLAGIREMDIDKSVPIVIRRAGPRDAEAFETLRKARDLEGYNIFLRGMGTPVNHSARMVVHHAKIHEAKRLKREQ